jgi:hypothetical protein
MDQNSGGSRSNIAVIWLAFENDNNGSKLTAFCMIIHLGTNNAALVDNNGSCLVANKDPYTPPPSKLARGSHKIIASVDVTIDTHNVCTFELLNK